MPSNRLLYISENIFKLRVKDQVVGSFLYDRFNETIARVDAVIVEAETYLMRYLVINMGGFMKIQGKKILLPVGVYEFADLGKVKTEWSRESLKDAPAPEDPENVSMDEEEEILGYFDLEPYWVVRSRTESQNSDAETES